MRVIGRANKGFPLEMNRRLQGGKGGGEEVEEEISYIKGEESIQDKDMNISQGM